MKLIFSTLILSIVTLSAMANAHAQETETKTTNTFTGVKFLAMLKEPGGVKRAYADGVVAGMLNVDPNICRPDVVDVGTVEDQLIGRLEENFRLYPKDADEVFYSFEVQVALEELYPCHSRSKK